MSSKFTCITCRVAFTEADIQRQHYKTDWHRYNLKRKVAELPPVTAEEFQRRVLLQREKDESNGRDTTVFCNVCRKSFSAQKSFENHLKSKRHIQLAEAKSTGDLKAETVNLGISRPNSQGKDKLNLGLDKHESKMSESDDSEIEEVDSDEWDEDISDDNPILRNDCLFCTHHSATVMKNVKHMSVEHSFFVPDIEYVVDMRGLLCYLGEKVTQGYMCLWCNDRGKAFYSAEAAKQHMIDKGHCKMLHEGEALLEYADFYDYTSSYPENLSTGESSEEEVSLPVHEEADYQLVLPSGCTIGHRSLMRYYRQNFDPYRVVVPVQKKVHRVIAQYKALGWTGSDKLAAAKKGRDLKFMQRVQSKYSMKLGMKANNLSVKRPQVNF